MSTLDAFYGYLAAHFSDADLLGQTDEQAAVAEVSAESRQAYLEILAQGRRVLAAPTLEWKRIGGSANRYFESETEARAWLTRMMNLLEARLEQL